MERFQALSIKIANTVSMSAIFLFKCLNSILSSSGDGTVHSTVKLTLAID